MSPSTEPIQSGSSTDPAIANTRVHDVFQSIVKGRKSWKTLKGGEVVWPPELEAALIEGLENYQPDDSRETRLLGRFPMRNRFISDWIFEKTGKKRTAKQVGSRLQQLRDTCGGKRLLNLLSPNRRFPRRPSLSPHCPSRDIPSYGAPTLPYDSESCSDSSGSPPSTPTNEAHSTLQKLLYRGVEPRSEELPNTIVYIDVLPTGLSSSSPSTSRTPSEQAAEERSWTERGFQIVRPPQAPRRLVDIDPTITLASPNPIEATSHFTVLSDEGIVHSYSVQLEEVVSAAVPPPEMGTSLYKTRLVPEFWDTIVQCRDASRYVIIQRVVASPNSATPSTTLFEAMYKFNYTSLAAASAATAQPQVYSSPTMLPIDVSHPKQHDYNNYGILPMDNHFASEIMYPAPGKAAPGGGGGGAPANFFDFSYVQVPTEDDWGTASDTTGSVYASPIDTQKPIPFAMPGDEQLMSSPSSFHAGDISTYGL